MPGRKLINLATRRMRILWIVLGALLLVSVAPLLFYHQQVLKLSEEKLQDTARATERNHQVARQ